LQPDLAPANGSGAQPVTEKRDFIIIIIIIKFISGSSTHITIGLYIKTHNTEKTIKHEKEKVTK